MTNRVEPNALLALSTFFALLLAVITTAVYGPPIALVRNPLLAVICAVGFVLMNPMLQRWSGQPPRPPMINPETPGAALWGSLFPVIILTLAAIPVFRPGGDYGLIVIIAAVMFGVTLESALKARRG